MDSSIYEDIMSYAFALLSKRRYTEAGLKKKFKKRYGDHPEETKKALKRLTELNYIDDRYFAQEWVRTRRMLNPRGKFLLKQELWKKGIPKPLIEEVVEESVLDEYEDALRFIEKKKKKILSLPKQKRNQKIFYFLGSRGFSPETIYKVLESW